MTTRIPGSGDIRYNNVTNARILPKYVNSCIFLLTDEFKFGKLISAYSEFYSHSIVLAEEAAVECYGRFKAVAREHLPLFHSKHSGADDW